jgi:hypothetical protein
VVVMVGKVLITCRLVIGDEGVDWSGGGVLVVSGRQVVFNIDVRCHFKQCLWMHGVWPVVMPLLLEHLQWVVIPGGQPQAQSSHGH